MNAAEALNVTRIVRAAFPAQKFDEFTIDVWAEALKDVSYYEARDAITRLVTKQTFASVAEIIEEARTYRREATRRLNDQATFRAIEESAEQYDRRRAHEAYLDTRQAFTEAIEAKRVSNPSTVVGVGDPS